MRDTIYTIPVSEAFEKDCECPLCELERKLENEYVEYVLGASLMEPDNRKLTNDQGFCRKHFEMIYNKQENKLGLALMMDTHMIEQNKKLNRIMGVVPEGAKENTLSGKFSSLFHKDKGKADKETREDPAAKGSFTIDRVLAYLEEYEHKCYICNKLDYTMNRYIEVIYDLYFSQTEFRKMFELKKGFCLPHLKLMLQYAKKLDSKKRDQVVGVILKMQADNMARVQQELNWFTKKFDYRYDAEPWGNSKDAIPRGIKKLTGPCRFK